MFRKLRLKFICISMLSVVIVLSLVLGLVNFITYKNAESEIYSTLNFIAKHGDDYQQINTSYDYTKYEVTPETQYETRYMIITLDEKGVFVSLNDDHIAAISENDQKDFIDKAVGNDDEKGIFEFNNLNYAFLKTTGDNYQQITIIDCTRNMSSVHFFFKFSFYVGALSVLLLLLILSLFARRVVKPYVKNAEAQKQFITNASHELKTPLAVISANTEVLEMTSGKNEWTESTVKQVKRMTELISQLVVLSRLEEREDLVLSDVNISEETKKSVENYKTVAETKGLTLNSGIEEDIHIEADEKGIFELINILLDNAVKYCDEEGVIELSLNKKGKSAILEISNDYAEGEGVDYSRFFDRFYREDASHNNENEGYGIGLSMAESLVRMFKGKIHVNYKKKRIIFTVTL